MIINFERFGKGTLEYFIASINNGLKTDRNDKKITLNMSDDFFSAPEEIAPLAGIIDFLKESGFSIKVDYNKNKIKSSGLNNPFTVAKNEYELLSPMYKVWKYNTSEEVNRIVNSLVYYLNSKVVCAKGVVEAFEWTVNEVMDNVIQHSKSHYGFLVCTVTANSHISVAIYDNGIGILKSFQGSKYRFRTPIDAIISAMQEETTSNPTIGQGNGLWGMAQLVENNKGSLSILSSSAKVFIDENKNIQKTLKQVSIYGKKTFTAGTLVDFQFQCNNEVSMKEVFGSNYSFTNLALENLEDDNNRIIVKVKDFPFGYATRESGGRARNLIKNYIIQSENKQIIIIDFEGIGIVSSSFSDEFLGKLILDYGFIQFNNLIKIANISESNMAIINRSIMQRIAS